MATYDASVKKALTASQQDLVDHKEGVNADAGLVVIAPHGGDIEPHTDQQAERVASRLAARPVTLWRFFAAEIAAR